MKYLCIIIKITMNSEIDNSGYKTPDNPIEKPSLEELGQELKKAYNNIKKRRLNVNLQDLELK